MKMHEKSVPKICKSPAALSLNYDPRGSAILVGAFLKIKPKGSFYANIKKSKKSIILFQILSFLPEHEL